MSWNAYVDNLIGQSGGHLSKGCIIGLEGGVWTPGAEANLLQVSAAEASAVGKVMKTKNSTEVQQQFAASGITLEGQKYMFIRDMQLDGRCVVGKKAGFGAVTLQSTKTAVVIGFTPEGKEQRAATNAVNTIAEYLEKSNY